MNHSTAKAPFSQTTPFASLSEALPHNPFLAPDITDVPADAPEGAYTYALVQSAPAVPAEETEVNAAAVEVVLRWGRTVLSVAHLTPPRSFHVGEPSQDGSVDVALPATALGASRFPLVRKMWDGSARAVIPAGAKGTIHLGDEIVKISDLAASGRAEASREIKGALEVALRQSTRVRFEVDGIEFEIAGVQAGRKVSGRFSMDRRGLPAQALSMFIHLGLLGAAAMLMPPMALASEDSLTHDQMEVMRSALMTQAEREAEVKQEESPAPRGEERATSRESGNQSPRGNTPGGSKGAPRKGSDADPHVRLTREEALQKELDGTMVGVLKSGAADMKSAPAWGDSTALYDAGSPTGRNDIWLSSLDETSGTGGLTLNGIGDGTGGPGNGIRLGSVGTTHNVGIRRLLPGGHKPSELRVRPGVTTTSSAHLPPEVIQRIVRQNFGRFRLCYENGLRNNPNLAGRVSVRFVIGRDGGVNSVANGGADIPDGGMVACVVRSFYGLSFPAPAEGGAVTVTYPISFSPAK